MLKETHTHTHTHLSELLLLQIPFFDAVVSRPAEQHISLYSQTLDAIVMGRLKVMSWTYVAQSSLCHVKHLKRAQEAGDCKRRVCICDTRVWSQYVCVCVCVCGWYLDIMVFGASDNLVFAQQRLTHCQAHDGADVTCQLPHPLHPIHKHTHTHTHKIQTGTKQRR